ncbi:MAG: glycosyltransferase [Oscillospiraceae bacterium]|nr:glycosyltransferase [Oscillospiraceae bacterium]
MEKLSFVIPCYGSELTIEGVLDEIHLVMSQRPEYDYEIICVNDCSPDNVLEVLTKRAQVDSKLTVADLIRNMGKACAMLAGYSFVTGDYVVDLDDDGQCPMYELWKLFEPIQNGYDVVFADYIVKKQPLFSRFGSKVNRMMTHIFAGNPKDIRPSNFSILTRVIVDEIKKYSNAFPYTLGLIFRTTKKIANVPMQERERTVGKSNFTLMKSLSLWSNGLTAFSIKPLRLSSIIGALVAVGGFIYGLTIVIQRLFVTPNMATGFPSIMAALLLIGGVIMMMLGMLGEYVGRIYVNQNTFSQYVIRNVYKSDSACDEN